MLQGSFGVIEVIFIGESRYDADDCDAVHVQVAMPHNRDRDAVRCITITTLGSDQASIHYVVWWS